MSYGHLPPELSSSPPGPYHQEPYISKPEERFKAPPILPPHLLQVILNKDTGISVSITQTFPRPSSMVTFRLSPLATSGKAAGENVQCRSSVFMPGLPLITGKGCSQNALRADTTSPSHTAFLSSSSCVPPPSSLSPVPF